MNDVRMATLLLGWVFCMSVTVQAAEQEQAHPQRIVFLGDSITQAGAEPGGYVALVRDMLEQQHPDQKIEVVGAGISGNRVPDLEKRLDRDVLSKQPSLVVIYIGINDVWHSLQKRGTSKEDFERGLRGIIERIRAAGSDVILATPSVIGEKHDGSNELDAMLEQYSEISRRIAADTKVSLLDLRKEFLTHLREHNRDNRSEGVLTTDGVHLNAAGNKFVAEKMAVALAKAVDHPLLRHVVLFKFKDDISPEQIQEVVTAFGELPEKIPTIVDFEHGTDVSVENRAEGYTHGFLVTFRSTADRDAYLPHPAHQEFVNLVGPRLEKALVFDYWAKH